MGFEENFKEVGESISIEQRAYLAWEKLIDAVEDYAFHNGLKPSDAVGELAKEYKVIFKEMVRDDKSKFKICGKNDSL